MLGARRVFWDAYVSCKSIGLTSAGEAMRDFSRA